jgi:NADP-dependent 3-hydroxy acid dehydrogenase YdfG
MTGTRQTAAAAAALTIGGALISRALRASRRIDLHGRSVAITGGSRGLGLALAREFAAHGARLTLAARDVDELARARAELESRGAEVSTVVCDVRQRLEAERFIEVALAEKGRLDVLVNNAGVIKVGPVEHMALEDFEEAMAVHFWGPLYATLAALPAMRRQGLGRVVNISSIGGRIGVPHLVPYCASKFALVGLSEAMRTGSPFNAWFKGRHRDEFVWFVLSDSLPLATIDARPAARQIVEACRRGDAELVITWPAKLAVFARAAVPESLALAMSVVNRLVLPPPAEAGGTESHSGWQSLSGWTPAVLTRLTERAAAENNELPVSGRDRASERP